MRWLAYAALVFWFLLMLIGGIYVLSVYGLN